MRLTPPDATSDCSNRLISDDSAQGIHRRKEKVNFEETR